MENGGIISGMGGTEFWTETFAAQKCAVLPRYTGDFVDGLFHGNGELRRPDGIYSTPVLLLRESCMGT